MDLCFVDTETTSLSAERGRIWEFAAIRRTYDTDSPGFKNSDQVKVLPDGTECVEHVLNFQISVDLGDADPMSLKIGRYHERFNKKGRWYGRDEYELIGDQETVQKTFIENYWPKSGQVAGELDAALVIEEFTRDTHLIGNVVSFDSERIERFLRNNFQCPGWHYHVIDMEPVIVGYAKAKGAKFTLPYRSNDLSLWLGVEPPKEGEDLHTALGDARWVQRMWDAIFHDA